MAQNNELDVDRMLSMLDVLLDTYVDIHGIYATIQLLLERGFSIQDLKDLRFDDDYIKQVATELGYYKGDN